MTDPWLDQETNTNNSNTCKVVNKNDTEFEDSFESFMNVNDIDNNKKYYQPLSDSKEYVLSLERKLQKLKNGSKLIDALSEKREDCLRSLLQNTEIFNRDILELEGNIGRNSDSVLQNFHRFIQPMQPATLGETVEFIKYDQLQQQHLDNNKEDNKNKGPIH